jgi:hypothetical protein
MKPVSKFFFATRWRGAGAPFGAPAVWAPDAVSGGAEKGDHPLSLPGISARPFKRVFNLADYIQVKDASFDNGLLKISLVREIPEAMKPRRIAIASSAGGNDNQQLEHKQAA